MIQLPQKILPDPSVCFLNAFGTIQHCHEYTIDAQEERGEAQRAVEQVREEEKGSEGAGKRRVKGARADKRR